MNLTCNSKYIEIYLVDLTLAVLKLTNKLPTKFHVNFSHYSVFYLLSSEFVRVV